MTILEPIACSVPVLPRLLRGAAVADFSTYLVDESRRSGHADAVAFPGSSAEVCGAVLWAVAQDVPVTVSGARTGITAGAVPEGGLLLSLERMNRIRGLARRGDSLLLYCEAGVLLADIQKSLQSGDVVDAASWDADSREVLAGLHPGQWFYPPDPTENSAAIGGTIACNASGAHSFRYGPTRPYVERLRLVLPDGRLLDMERGQYVVGPDGRFGIRQADGSVREVEAPTYNWPQTKNAGGYRGGAGEDLIDLFIGSEGTLGIITEAEIRLLPAPEARCALMSFWDSEAAALAFTREVRSQRDALGVEAIEYVGERALAMLLRRREALGSASGVPVCIPGGVACGIYLDIGTDAPAMPAVLARLAELLRRRGGNPDSCWAAVERDERERLRVFRHALPETVNATIAEIRREHPTVTKLGTDMAVPDEYLETVVALYRGHLDAVGLDYVIFGHIGDNHLHVNILPRNPEEYALGRTLYADFAETVVAMGGSPAAEHGIGKLKTGFLIALFGEEGVAQMRRIKACFDPENRLGRGTLFTWKPALS